MIYFVLPTTQWPSYVPGYWPCFSTRRTCESKKITRRASDNLAFKLIFMRFSRRKIQNISTVSTTPPPTVSRYNKMHFFKKFTLSDFGPVSKHRFRGALRGREMVLGKGGQRQAGAERDVPKHVHGFRVDGKQPSDTLRQFPIRHFTPFLFVLFFYKKKKKQKQIST